MSNIAFSDGSPSERRALERRQVVGLLAAIAIHVVILLAIFSSMRGAVVTGGAEVGETVTPIVLVSLAGLHGSPHQPAPTAELDAIFKKLRAAEAPVTIDAQKTTSKAPPKNSLDKLLEEVDHDAHADDKPGTGGRSTDDRKGQGAAKTANTKQPLDTLDAPPASHAGIGNNSPSSGGLWGQIEPCWRKLPGVSSVPVTLDIVLDEAGRIAVPPRIIRPTPKLPEESRLLAEARALAAISACIPYHGPGGFSGKRTFRVDFQNSR